MSPQNDPHFQLIADLNMILAPQVQGRHTVSVQGPLQVDEISEPEPDLAILPLPRYRGVGKTGEALLVIEVAESSLPFDLGEKARRYAAAGYPEYWVIDTVQRILVRHLDPNPDGTWTDVADLTSGVLQPVAVADVQLDLDDLFDF
jgi:Uma2 family endonuclease